MCQDVVTLELQLKCQMISGEFSYTFGNRPFQENLQSEMEAFHLQLSEIIKANLEHTFSNKVLHHLVKKGSSGFKMTTDQSVYLRNCCSDLVRTFLIRAQIFEQEGKFQLAFDSAKQGLLLLGNINSYNNSDMVFLRAGLALSLANNILYVSNCIDINELLKSNFDIDLLSSQLSDMSLNTGVQCSPLCSDKNSGDNLEFCVGKIAAMSLEEDSPKDRVAEKSKKTLESVKETKSGQNDILLSPFPKKEQLPKEKVSMETSLAIQSDVKELHKDEAAALNTECGPKIKTKTVRKTFRFSRISRAASKPKETLLKRDSEIETGRECSYDDVGDGCKIGNFDRIIEKEIEGPEKGAILEEQTSEKLSTIEDLAPHSQSLADSTKLEGKDLKLTGVKAQDSKKLKASKNVRVTKTRASRANTISENIPDSKTDENKLPVVEEGQIKSPCEKKKSTTKKTSRANNRNGRNCTVKMPQAASPSPLASKREKIKSESKIFKSRKAVDNNVPAENESEEMNIYDFDGIDKEVPVKKVGKSRRQPAAKTKSNGWQKKLAEASNRIGREVKRDASSPLEKRFCISPVSLTPAFPLNENSSFISLSDTDSPISSASVLDCFSFEEIKMDMKGWESFSEDLLNVSSPELLRAAKTGNNSDDRNTYRDKRATRRAPARSLVPTVDKKSHKKDKTIKDCQGDNSGKIF